MSKVQHIKALERKIITLETQIKHLTNELYLTKEEHEISAKNYFGIYSDMEKIIAKRTKKLLESEEKYRRIFENIQDVYYEANLEGDILEVSPSVENISEYNREELIGNSLLDIYVDPHKRDELVNELLSRGRVNDYEIELKDKDGSLNFCAISAIIAKDGEGNPEKIIGSMRDITRRKKTEEDLWRSEHNLRISERKLKSIVNNAPDVIFMLNPDGKIVFINKTINEYGYSTNELIGKSILELVHPKDRKKAIYSVKERRTGNRSTKLVEIRLLTKGTETIPLESKSRDFGNFMIDAEGIYSSEKPSIDSFVGTIVVARDISERKRIEGHYQKTRKLEAIGVLAGGIAHDFNNLLSIIMGNIDLAKDEMEHEVGIFNFLIEAEKATLRARELSKQLITFSQGGEPVMKNGLIEKLIKVTAKTALTDSNIKCELSLPHNLWVVKFDEDQMKRVILNLIRNAVDSMTNGGVLHINADNFYISSKILKQDVILPEGKYVRISIQDEGTGIPEEHLSMIFDPYFSTKKMGTQKGMGLGLAITYSIIQKHNGYITVESEVGIGTTFTVYLPAIGKDIQKLEIRETSRSEKSKVRNGRILLMDDEDMIIKVTGSMLLRLGYDPEVSQDGSEAIKIYQQAMSSERPFDAVILDLSVKDGLGGLDTIKTLKEMDPQVKAIVSSGFSNDPVMTRFKEYGFQGALPKPYKIKDIEEELHKIVEG